jgi:hypothetical protein
VRPCTRDQAHLIGSSSRVANGGIDERLSALD